MMLEEDAYTGYDLIGDVHGCANTLAQLLDLLGYHKVRGVWQYRDQRKPRQVIFVGDIVDRGPRIREALHTVREMVERGSAVLLMGNHEYNALGYCTPKRITDQQRSPQLAHGDRGKPYLRDQYLRDHTPRHELLIRETLAQFENHPDDWKDFLAWFVELPVFLEYPHFRVVHACWDNDLIEQFRKTHGRNHIDEDFLHASAAYPSFAHLFMDRLTRGIDLSLPEGQTITGQDGIVRDRFRVKFWADDPASYDDIAFQPDPLPAALAAQAITEQDRQRLLSYAAHRKPLFVGHYWLNGEPQLLRPNLACLDYSAVKKGRLVAYRLNRENMRRGIPLHPQHFVSVGSVDTDVTGD